MGLNKVIDRVRDPTLQEAFDGLFPRDNPENSRFSINFFTTIGKKSDEVFKVQLFQSNFYYICFQGLGGLTEDLRAHLKKNPNPVSIGKKNESSR
jgi:pre-mRNA-splicing factor CWC22